MSKSLANFGLKTLTLSMVTAMTATTSYAEDVVANSVNVVGLQRVTPDSLQSVLPITSGQLVGDDELANSIRALYATGQFSNVQAKIDNNNITFYVTERPMIADVKFEGNRLIPKDGLEQGLKQAGLAVGSVLKQSTVQMIEGELENQYISQGYYNIDVEVTQTELDGNRVKLDIKFDEGKPARVVDINFIGNEHFSDKELKDEFIIKDNKINPLSKGDRYTQEKMNASLEAVKAKYLNNGFVRFNVDKATLNVDDEKQKAFIEATITEGQQYKFGEVQFLGEPTYESEELKELIKFKSGTVYSQKQLDESSAQIANKFGDDGYYRAQIRPINRIDDENLTVDIDYYIDPARPVYVRRISFSGNNKTKDEVLRREMRQLEGALTSNQKIQLSQARLMRTGFFKDVKVEVRPVPNSPDQVDLVYQVEEQPSGSSTIAAGYSQSGGMTFQVDLSQSNFMGTGNRVNASFARSETRDVYSLGVTDPFFTVNGVSQSANAYYRKTKYDSKNISNYVLDSYGLGLNYGYPIDEKQRLNGGFFADSTKVRGGPYMGIANIKEMIDDEGNIDATNSVSFDKKYTTYGATLGWSYSSLDRGIFPTKGVSHNVDVTLGLGDKNYQKVVYRANAYYPLWKGMVLRGHARLGYGNNLPFYENFYAGGYGSVRGFESSSLGPQSQAYTYLANGQRTARGEEIGGNAVATFGAELILPVPFKGDWAQQVRPVLFFDAGQVFDTTNLDKETVNLPTLGLTNNNVTYIEQDKELRYSVGFGTTWYTPIGPISLSYSKPLNAKEGDKTEKLQFQIGSVF
ncbi:outer membrane protein assembly factor BamA [Moraxella oblonga]|uniref:outer membrane protein assembly factor BamA n=1 Tax=Moraxella oblonga TaxID=200413 RepID=UPI00083678CE|nr:outer membrane protein assembly factor BamA [Moraxella oblonga]